MTYFVKMHGNGNDFIVVDEWGEVVVDDKEGFASRYCTRRFGVGANGVIFVSRSNTADVRMRLFQPDGGEAEMCGNGIRCLVRYAVEEGYASAGGVRVETPSGVRKSSYDGEVVTVEMGAPSFEADEVPAERRVEGDEIGGYEVTACNTGVPHAVVFVDDVNDVDVEADAPAIRNADVFPEGANVNFASRKGDVYEVRTFERGVEGETLSCGTGAVAVASVAVERGDVDADDVVPVSTRGGDLHVYFEDGNAFMQGTAERVYEGRVENE